MYIGKRYNFLENVLFTLHTCACMCFLLHFYIWKEGYDIMGKTSAAVKNRYAAKVYDRINLTVKKGQKNIIQAHAEQQGESINAFINRAIDETISNDATKNSPTNI